MEEEQGALESKQRVEATTVRGHHIPEIENDCWEKRNRSIFSDKLILRQQQIHGIV